MATLRIQLEIVRAALESDQALYPQMPRYPLLSAGLIGRLVVDRRYQGHGWGGLMVVDAAARAIRADPAFYALIVDAEDDHAAAFYARLGFQCFTGHERRLFIPLSEIVKRL